MRINNYAVGVLMAATAGSVLGGQFASEKPTEIKAEISQLSDVEIPQAEIDLDTANNAWRSTESVLGSACVAAVEPYLPHKSSATLNRDKINQFLSESGPCGSPRETESAFSSLSSLSELAHDNYAKLQTLTNYRRHLETTILPAAETQRKYDKPFMHILGAVASASLFVGLVKTRIKRDKTNHQNIPRGIEAFTQS